MTEIGSDSQGGIQPQREFIYEKSSFYEPLWYRREVVLSAGPDDTSPLSTCRSFPCGLHFPHTVDAEHKLVQLWGGMNGLN
ncbi:MAG: hypothetical protein ABI577_04815 [bacterium]